MELNYETVEKVFKNWLVTREYAKDTQKNKLNVLAQLFQFMEARGKETVPEFTKQELESFVKWRYEVINSKGKQNGVSQRNNEIAVVNQLYDVLAKMDLYLPATSMRLLYGRESSMRLPKDILSTRDIVKVMRACDLKTFEGLRLRLILELFVATGIRQNELIGIKGCDIDSKDRRIIIRDTKTKRDRVVVFNLTCGEILEMYLARCRGIQDSHVDDFLFCVFGKPLQPHHVETMFKCVSRKVNLKSRVSARKFRHRFATQLVSRGMPVRVVQELLGHTDLDTTMRYVKLNDVAVVREFRRFHPRGER